MMQSEEKSHKGQNFFLGLWIALGLIAASVILASGASKVVRFGREVITVTGSAQRELRSDFIVWRCSFSRRSPDLQEAYSRLLEDLSKVKGYLEQQGIGEEQMIVSAVNTQVIYRRGEGYAETNQVEGYRLEQTIEIRSGEVDPIAEISRKSSELIQEGVEFHSSAPQYFYTRLEDLKVEMLARATENAKERAIQMTQATGNRIGPIRSAKMGVFQITPVNSTEISGYGMNDTSSLDKKITAVVHVTFAIK